MSNTKAVAKPPYKILFSNDTTNTLSCVSPYHGKGEPFTEDLLIASIDETANTGIDVHMLQPHVGWIAWWQSKVYPMEEHHKWFKAKTGLDPDSYDQYILDGGDMVKVFVDRCRQKKLVPFVSLRLNDAHHTFRTGVQSKFYDDHPEYRIGGEEGRENTMQGLYHGLLDWSIQEVRQHKLDFIQELCEGYDIDGFELDFVRMPCYFNLDETTSLQRVNIMNGFIEKVRGILNRTTRKKKRRWLCARIPNMMFTYDSLGLDVQDMVDAGLDMINLSAHYFTEQNNDLIMVRKLVPDASIYVEMTHCTKTVRGGFIPTTPRQFYTTAALSYENGADGMSVFNFYYYRQHGYNTCPANEPPFHIFKHLRDKVWLSKQPKYYVPPIGWYNKTVWG